MTPEANHMTIIASHSVNQKEGEFLIKAVFDFSTQLDRLLSTLVYGCVEGAALELKGRKEHRRLRMQNYKFRNNIGPHVRRSAASARRLQWAHRRAALPPLPFLHVM